MANRTWVADLPQRVGEVVLVRGWVRHQRSAGKLHFVEVRDGSGVVQAVVKKGQVPEADLEAVPARFRERLKAMAEQGEGAGAGGGSPGQEAEPGSGPSGGEGGAGS